MKLVYTHIHTLHSHMPHIYFHSAVQVTRMQVKLHVMDLVRVGVCMLDKLTFVCFVLVM